MQSLTGGGGAAWNARARFPGASTMKLAIAAAVLARHTGIPAPESQVSSLLSSMLTHSDNASANALEVWLGGSTSAGSQRVNELMRSIGMRDSEMYGGYELRTLASRIPVRVEQQPAYGYGKHTTAWDIATLLRAVWLASGGRGPLRAEQPGFTAADGRYLLWLLAHVSDVPKLDRVRAGNPGVVVMHKAGWVNDARHDSGLVFWRGGVFVASVMTWSSRGVGVSADVLAGQGRDASAGSGSAASRGELDAAPAVGGTVSEPTTAFDIRTKARTVSENSIRLLLVPLEDIVVFPNMNVTLTVDVGDEERVLLVPKHEDEYAKVGTVAEVTDRIRLPGGGLAVALNGLHRGVAGAATSDAQGRLFVEVEERPDGESADGSIRELEREYRATVEEILELRGDDGRIAAFVRSISEPGALADTVRLLPRPDLRAEDAPARDGRRA